jgi:hypothetical protein
MSCHHARLSILYSLPVFSAMFVWLCLRNVSLSFVSFLFLFVYSFWLTHDMDILESPTPLIALTGIQFLVAKCLPTTFILRLTHHLSFFSHFVCRKILSHPSSLFLFNTLLDSNVYRCNALWLRLDVLRNFVRHSFICQPVNIWRWRWERIIYILCYVYHLHSPFIFYKIIFA